MALHSMAFVIILSTDKWDWLKVMTSRGIGYVKREEVEIKESYAKAKE